MNEDELTPEDLAALGMTREEWTEWRAEMDKSRAQIKETMDKLEAMPAPDIASPEPEAEDESYDPNDPFNLRSMADGLLGRIKDLLDSLPERERRSTEIWNNLPEEERQRRTEHVRQGMLREWGEEAYLMNEDARTNRTPLDERFPQVVAEHRERNGLPQMSIAETIILINKQLDRGR